MSPSSSAHPGSPASMVPASSPYNSGSSQTATEDGAFTPATVSASSLEEYYSAHLDDPNFDLRAWHPSASRRSTASNLDGTSQPSAQPNYEMRSMSGSLEDVEMEYEESPYPEVRAAVSSVDDVDMPVNTFRMWFIGLFFVFAATIFNQVLVFRYPGVLVTGIVIQLLSLPLGRLLAHILPRTTFTLLSHKWTLNPGPFSIKEHVCITIMGNLACNGVYAMETVICRRIFYGMHVPFKHQFLIALGTQVFGFSLAGLMRRFVVWPARMIWPNVLAACVLYNSLHQSQAAVLDDMQQEGRRKSKVKSVVPSGKEAMSRGRFFLYSAVAAFVWAWFPGYIFTALSMFNWLCWIWPRSPVVNVLFGSATGLGMSTITLDWSMIAYFGSPLVNPWWAQSNVCVSFILFVWIIIPALYFKNVFFSSHFPPMSTSAFANDGKRYQILEVLTDGMLDPAKYSAYSPPFLPISFAMAYAISFATFAAIAMHTFLWFRKDIVRQFRRTLKDEHDIHSRLMQSYPEVSAWWYAITGSIALIFIFISNAIVPTQLPPWALTLSLLLALIFVLPLSMLQAIANQAVSPNPITQLLCGYILPGRPVANMLFKTFTGTTIQQSIVFTMDLKTGHYMKVPPKIMFLVQLVGAVVGSVLVVLVEAWIFDNIPDMCSDGQKDGFICPGSRVFFTSSVIWGGVGPAKLFSPGMIYAPLLSFFLLGLLLPLPFFFLAKRYPLGIWRYINIPIFFGGLQGLAPGTGMNLSSWLLVGFIFNYIIRRRWTKWWVRYNYLLSAALDTGVAFAFLGIFFLVMVPKGGLELNWWGNSVWMNTNDAEGVPYMPIPDGSTIGPSSW